MHWTAWQEHCTHAVPLSWIVRRSSVAIDGSTLFIHINEIKFVFMLLYFSDSVFWRLRRMRPNKPA
jgi:hypothetical protein